MIIFLAVVVLLVLAAIPLVIPGRSWELKGGLFSAIVIGGCSILGPFADGSLSWYKGERNADKNRVVQAHLPNLELWYETGWEAEDSPGNQENTGNQGQTDNQEQIRKADLKTLVLPRRNLLALVRNIPGNTVSNDSQLFQPGQDIPMSPIPSHQFDPEAGYRNQAGKEFSSTNLPATQADLSAQESQMATQHNDYRVVSGAGDTKYDYESQRRPLLARKTSTNSHDTIVDQIPVRKAGKKDPGR